MFDSNRPGDSIPQVGENGQPANVPGSPFPYGTPDLYSYGPLPRREQADAAPGNTWRRLIKALVGGVIILALLGGGAVVGITQYQAPAQAAQQFCNAVKLQDYTSAYSLLASSLRAQYPSIGFSSDLRALDHDEGDVTDCTVATGAGYSYTLFGSTADVSLAITRAHSGMKEGQLRLVNQSGWKLISIATSLMGVNLASLQAVAEYCAGIQTQNYALAYSVFGSTLRTETSQSDYTQVARLRDQIDGKVIQCGVSGLGQGNTDRNTNLTVSISRSKLGETTGPAKLDVESNAWRLTSLDGRVQGSDPGGVLLIDQFCTEVVANNSHAAYVLTSSAFQTAVPELAFDQVFGALQGQTTYVCTPQLTSFVQSDPTNQQIHVNFTATSTASTQSVSLPFTAYLVEGGATWQISGIQF